MAAKFNFVISNTIEPPVSDHPKCKDLVVAYGRWSAYKNRTTGRLSEEEVRVHLLY